jgi:S1-C subfamily serine protease
VARDSIGARVAGVTPGGPADRAGVQTGDLITRLNGTRLAAEPQGDGDEYSSRPAERLLRIASRLEPGDTVRLDLRRGAQTVQVSFVTEASDMDRVVERMRLPMMHDFQGQMTEPGEGRMRVFAFGGGPSDLELVAVNPGLGDYFGTTEGLLVVDVGSDTTLGLRAGDVILQLGGRRPQSPAHAMRILATYEPGEEVRFDIMRQKRRATVNGRMPRRDARWRIEPNAFEMRIPQMMDELEPMLRMREPMREMHRELPRMRMGTPEIQDEAPKSLQRTDGWT